MVRFFPLSHTIVLHIQFAQPTYRRTLTLSFFYKYYHELLLTLSLPAPGLTATATEELTTEIHRVVSSGSRDNSDPYAQEIVGRQIRKHSSF